MNKGILVALIAAGALTAPSVARADVVTDWNKTMVDALYATHTAPQPSSRIRAIVRRPFSTPSTASHAGTSSFTPRC